LRPSDLDKAAEILNSERNGNLAGRGALHAATELEQTADMLAPSSKLCWKAAFLTTARTRRNDRPARNSSVQVAMEDCDILLMVGNPFPYLEFMPKPATLKECRWNWIQNASASISWSTLVWSETAAACWELLLAQASTNRSFLEKAQKEWKTGGRSCERAQPVNFR